MTSVTVTPCMTDGVSDPTERLRQYREDGLRSISVSGEVRFALTDAIAFLDILRVPPSERRQRYASARHAR